MSSDTASTQNPNPDTTQEVSDADTQGHTRFEPIRFNGEDAFTLEDTPQRNRPSAISSSADNYGTFVVENAPLEHPRLTVDLASKAPLDPTILLQDL